MPGLGHREIKYVMIARQLQVDVTNGYLFRPTTPQGEIRVAPLSSSTAEARLKGYLKEMGTDEGRETLHGFRSGCAITLALSGADLSEIMDHVGWTRRHTALHYLQLAKVLNPTGASGRLAAVGSSPVTTGWEEVNTLKCFVSAFPVNETLKRSFSE